MEPFAGSPPQSLRAALAAIEAAGELTRIAGRVDPRFEVSACLAAAPAGRALLFEQVGASALPLVGNVLTSRDRMALALGIRTDELQTRIVAAIMRPLPALPVGESRWQEVVVGDPDLAELPLPTFFEHETGPYVTAGAIVARHSETGAANLSIARLKPLGGNRAMIGIAPNHHLAAMARAAAARGERLPIAIAIGVHPAVLIAACLYLPLGADELESAGALLGEPIEVGGTDSGLLVPAACELVLEATLDPEETVTEGPVSEYHGMYEDYGAGCVVTVQRLLRRRDALLHVIEPGNHPEHVLLGGVAIAAGLAAMLRRSFPFVTEVAMPAGGSGRLAAVVAIDAARAPTGAVRRLMLAIWAAVSIVRVVTVVSDDVDPWDAVAVEWARTCFARADRDLLVVPGVSTDRSDPQESGGTAAKLGIDATARGGDGLGSLLAVPPRAAREAARRLLGLG